MCVLLTFPLNICLLLSYREENKFLNMYIFHICIQAMVLPFSENYLLIRYCLLLTFWETVSIFTPSFEFCSSSMLSYPHNYSSPTSLPHPIAPSRFFCSFTVDLYRIRLEHIQELLEIKYLGVCYFGNFSCSAEEIQPGHVLVFGII